MVVNSRENTAKPNLKQPANVLASLHCGHCRQLRMRRHLTIWQPGLHSPLCSGFSERLTIWRHDQRLYPFSSPQTHALVERSEAAAREQSLGS